MNATSPTSPASDSISTAEIDASCRVPLFTFFVSGAVWLVLASFFGLIASLKFHKPDMFADCALLTYGRVHAVATNAFLYGFALQTGFGVALWIIARTGQTRVVQPWMIAIGGKLWNLGLTLGVIGILIGDSTGFEYLEIPRYGFVFLFLGYLLIGFFSLVTLHNRKERALEPSQWFLLAALFWFPWIYFTANYLLLSHFPIHGVTQAIVAWWYSANLCFVWFGLVGLGALFYFFELGKLLGWVRSRNMALFIFWTVILFASWSGIPESAPVPAWLPSVSTVARVLMIVTVLAVVVDQLQMIESFESFGLSSVTKQTRAAISKLFVGNGDAMGTGNFIVFGIIAFLVSWTMSAIGAIPGVSSVTNLTWFTVAQWQMNVFGFFAMTMFFWIYAIVPQVTGLEWPSAKFVKWHFWFAAIGIVLIVLPLAIGGIVQGFNWHNVKMTNVEVAKSQVNFLRISTLGELLIFVGNLMLLGNLVGLSVRYYKTHFVPVYREATAELKPAEVKP